MGKVVINVQGGVMEVEELPTNIELEVRDYDIDAYDADDERIQLDEGGRKYVHRRLVGVAENA